MSDLLPVHEVLTVVDRNSREILEAAGYQIVILSYTAYAWVRTESFHYRIVVSLRAHGDGKGDTDQ
jgi:hypothetical protein